MRINRIKIPLQLLDQLLQNHLQLIILRFLRNQLLNKLLLVLILLPQYFVFFNVLL